MLSKDDERNLADLEISADLVLEQIEKFKRGFDFIQLATPAVVGNGILKLSTEQEKHFQETYDAYNGSVAKFVPASGAATRMFKHLFEFLYSFDNESSHDQLVEEGGSVFDFFMSLESFAFYDDLKSAFLETHGLTIEEAHLRRSYDKILEVLLKEEGLNYGSLPKGLLKFHQSEVGPVTPVQEHVSEGMAYATKNGTLNLHFTVSPEHFDLFQDHVEMIVKHTQKEIEVAVDFSTQKHRTDTIAVDLANKPLRDNHGKLVFRPSGHGALLENLNEQEYDVVFLKNIDNVVPAHLQGETIRFKRILAGVLISYQSRVFELLRRSEEGEEIGEEALDILGELGLTGSFSQAEILEYLNRPIRVCGMVVNRGEPGGGPFWVKSGKDKQSLQIVEKAQVNLEEESQLKIFEQSTHFNPVDVVCGLRDYKGNKFNLLKYRDPETGFITEKSRDGKALKAMELPGLWNGSMADWNTVFVEVPLITFNPVKTVNDLLKEEHQ